jgi:hypothetical protein
MGSHQTKATLSLHWDRSRIWVPALGAQKHHLVAQKPVQMWELSGEKSTFAVS